MTLIRPFDLDSLLATSLSALIDDFRSNVTQNRDSLLVIARKNPHAAYQKVNELAVFVGSRHGVNLQLHFPTPAKINDVDSYGTENVGIVVDKWRKTFPLPRIQVKKKSEEIIPNARAQDAYMYEGKEGVKVVLPEGRIEILPGSIHLWCKIDEHVGRFGDWLMENVYFAPNLPADSG